MSLETTHRSTAGTSTPPPTVSSNDASPESAAARARGAPPVTREEVAAFFPPSYYYGGYYYDDFGYDGPYSVGTDGRTHRVCRHFLQGRCTWGTSCRFSHEVGQPMTGDSDEAPPFFAGELPPATAAATAPAAGASSTDNTTEPSGLTTHSAPQLPPPQPQYDASNEQLAYQQATLQARRHAVFVAALKANFQIRQLQEDGSGVLNRRGQVTLTTLTNVPNIVIDVLEEEEVATQLQNISSNPRIVAGGLHYLVGEATLFWSMMRLWHVNGRTGSAQWDALLDAAHKGLPVACMFYCSTVGCAVGRCAYLHTSSPLEVPSAPDESSVGLVHPQTASSTTAARSKDAPDAKPADPKQHEPTTTTVVAEGW